MVGSKTGFITNKICFRFQKLKIDYNREMSRTHIAHASSAPQPFPCCVVSFANWFDFFFLFSSFADQGIKHVLIPTSIVISRDLQAIQHTRQYTFSVYYKKKFHQFNFLSNSKEENVFQTINFREVMKNNWFLLPEYKLNRLWWLNLCVCFLVK